MESVRDVELYALAADALDPARAQALRAKLRGSPELRARYAEVQAALDRPARLGLEADEGWRVPLRPSQGLAGATQPALMMGEERRFVVRLRGVERPGERWLVVLRRAGEGPWRCVFPEHPEDRLTIDALPQEDGAFRFEVSAAADLDSPEWAVVLAPVTLELDWSASGAARWEALSRLILAGEVPVVRVRPEATEA